MSDAIFFLSMLPGESEYRVVGSTSEFTSTRLEGGISQFSRRLLNASMLVDCTWTVPKEKFEYLQAAYNVFINEMAPFEMDLITNHWNLKRVKAWFVPGSFNFVAGIQGMAYTVSAQVEVIPPRRDVVADKNYIEAMNGFDFNFLYYEDKLQKIVNVDWPKALSKN